MVGGGVNARLDAVVLLRVRAPSGVEADLSAIVDTGFSGQLATSGLNEQVHPMLCYRGAGQ